MLSARDLQANIRALFDTLPSAAELARAGEAARLIHGYTADEVVGGLAFATKALNARHAEPES